MAEESDFVNKCRGITITVVSMQINRLCYRLIIRVFLNDCG